MIYFFYGEDTFRIKQRLQELRAGLLATDSNLDIQTLNSAKLTIAELQQSVLTQSFLSPSRLLVVEQPISESSDDFRSGLLQLVEQPVPSGVVLVFVETEPDQRTKLFKRLVKFIAEPYPKLKMPEAKRWLQQQAEQRGAKLSPAASDLLINSFADDLWRLSSELDKLTIFSANQPIDAKTVEMLTPRPVVDDIFAAIEALSKKNFAIANRLINRQLTAGMSEQQMIAMIAYQFRNIVTIRGWLDQGAKSSDLAAKTGLHPYVVQKTAEAARRFTLADLIKIFYLLQRVDGAIKTGKTPPRVGLDILVAQAANA